MTRTVTGIWWSPTMEGTPAFIISAAFLGLGGVVGSFFALQNTTDGIMAMRSYLEQFLAVAQSGNMMIPGIWELLWRALRWPLAAFLFSFTALGLFGIPVLNLLRGFFLSFSIASFACAYGRKGLAVSFLLLGIPGLLTVPAFLLLSIQSFTVACRLAAGGGQKKREKLYGGNYFFRFGLCIAAVVLSVLIERYFLPPLVSGAAGALLYR